MKKMFFLSTFCLAISGLVSQGVASNTRIDWSNPGSISDSQLAEHIYIWTGFGKQIKAETLKEVLNSQGPSNIIVINKDALIEKANTMPRNTILRLQKCEIISRQAGTAYATVKCHFDHGIEMELKH